MTYSPVTLESLLAHQGWAMRIARRLVHEEGEAEELVQRTWMAALRSPPKSENGARAWIRKVILNLARERHRRQQARTRHERLHEPSEVDQSDLLERLSRTEVHRLLGERLLKLDEPYRTVVLQRFYEDLTSVEIAQRLGIPAGTVRWRLKMGLDQLRAELDRRSQGDRTRWVSAMLAFLGPPASHPSEALAQPATGSSASHVLGWTAVGAVGLFGVLYLRYADEPDRGDVHAASDFPLAEVDSPAPRIAPSQAREETALPSLPALGKTATSSAPTGLPLRVVDELGAPVGDASILVARADGFQLRAHSDEDGLAWLAVEPADVGALGLVATRGRVSVRALAKGHVASELVHVAPPYDAEHEVHLVVGGPDTALRGHVRDAAGRAVPGALVAWFVPQDSLDRPPEGDFTSPSYVSTTSDEEGAYELAHLAVGKGNVACFSPGFATSSCEYATPASDALDLVLERGATVTGTVHLPGGAPAVGVRVSCESLCKSYEWATGLPDYDTSMRGFAEKTTTDERGAFRLEGVNAGSIPRILWVVDPERGLMATTTLTLANESTEHWDAELGEHPALRLRFLDEGGHPLAGWLGLVRRPITGSWWVRRIAADDDGRVNILDCPENDNLYLDVLPPLGIGVSRAWRHLRASDEEQIIQVDMRAMARVQGRAVNDLGEPLLDGHLFALSIDTTLETPIARQANGAFAQELPPGTYSLLLRFENTARKLKWFALKAGEELALGDLVAPALGSLRLTVEDRGERDTVPSYAIFKINDKEGVKSSLLVGHGSIDKELVLPLFPGRYRVLFHGDGKVPDRFSVVRIQVNEETRLTAIR